MGHVPPPSPSSGRQFPRRVRLAQAATLSAEGFALLLKNPIIAKYFAMYVHSRSEGGEKLLAEHIGGEQRHSPAPTQAPAARAQPQLRQQQQ